MFFKKKKNGTIKAEKSLYRPWTGDLKCFGLAGPVQMELAPVGRAGPATGHSDNKIQATLAARLEHAGVTVVAR